MPQAQLAYSILLSPHIMNICNTFYRSWRLGNGATSMLSCQYTPAYTNLRVAIDLYIGYGFKSFTTGLDFNKLQRHHFDSLTRVYHSN